MRQAVDCIPLVVGDRAGFFLTGDLPTQRVVAVFALTAVGQAFFQQLTEVVPAQLMAAAIGVTDFQQAALTVVAVVGFVAMGVGLLGDIALAVALVLPASSAALHIDELAIVVVVASRFIFWRDNRNQTPGVVVLVFGDGTECIFFSDQATFVVIGSLRFCAVGCGLADQSCIFVMHVNLFAAIGVEHGNRAFVVPYITRFQLRVSWPSDGCSAPICLRVPIPRRNWRHPPVDARE